MKKIIKTINGMMNELYRREKISESNKEFYKTYGLKRKIPYYEYGELRGWVLVDRRKPMKGGANYYA